MTEIEQKIKEEVLLKARQQGLGEKCDTTLEARYADRLKANLRRLVELCLESGCKDFSDSVFIELEPSIVLQLTLGEFRLGGHERSNPHISWRYLTHVFNVYDKKYLRAIVEYLVGLNGKMIFSEKIISDDLISCRDMLIYIQKNFGAKL